MTAVFNTGAVAHVTNSATPSGTIAIPAGVLPADALYILIMVFSTAAGTLTATLSSAATAPVPVGGQQATGVIAGQQVTAGLWSAEAAAADPGAVLTFGATGGTGGSYWFNAGIVAYTGAAVAGFTDVQGGNKVAGQGETTGNITTPALVTGVADDVQIQFVTGGPPSGFDFSGIPAGLTGREQINHTGNQGLLLYIADGGGSAGPAGSAIGGTLWSGTPVGGAVGLMTSFTAGLAPLPPPAAVSLQQQQPGRSMLRKRLMTADL